MFSRSYFQLIIISISISFICQINSFSKPEWTWECQLDTFDGPSCVRRTFDNSTGNEGKRLSPGPCFLTCGPRGSLWPFPSIKTKLGKSLASFHPNSVVLSTVEVPSEQTKKMALEAWNITIAHIYEIYGNGLIEFEEDNDIPTEIHNTIKTIEVKLLIKNPDDKIRVGTDESYALTISSSSKSNDGLIVVIQGSTFFGVRNGLETLTQLIAFNEFGKMLEIVEAVEIEDRPKFMYRGLLIDTGRNFIPLKSLKKMVDAMAYNKLNMFHWHLTDSNSFPFESKSVPQVTAYGTYSSKKVYSVPEIQEFIEYANLRGIKIIPELDAPSHAGNGWQWGHLEGLGELALCVNAEPYREYCIQPPCGQLNPLNPNMYHILGKLYSDFLDVFDQDLFHMGNDEISYKCWLKSPEINQWLEDHNTTDLMELWGLFQTTARAELAKANDGNPISPIIWTSEMTSEGRRFLDPSDYVIQIWSESVAHDTSIRDILMDSYRVIFSNKDIVYLDHGYGPWRDNGFPPKDYAEMTFWQETYAFDILKITEKNVGAEMAEKLYNSGRIWGGEAALWSEKTDQFNMEMKLWPRAAAFAERMWSNPAPELPRFSYPRLINHRLRMIGRGFQPDTLLPESCHYLMGFCD